MANPSGKNSPSNFDEFAPTTPYGEKEQEQSLAKSVPIPGSGGLAIGTPHRATEIALKAAGEQRGQAAPPAQEPVIPPPQPVQAQDDVATIWQQVAQDPGASDLVKQYAASA